MHFKNSTDILHSSYTIINIELLIELGHYVSEFVLSKSNKKTRSERSLFFLENFYFFQI